MVVVVVGVVVAVVVAVVVVLVYIDARARHGDLWCAVST